MAVDAEMKRMIDLYIIEKSRSLYSIPIDFLVLKRTGEKDCA